MENKLISFEAAKLAKERGFQHNCLCYYFEDSEFRKYKLQDTYGYYGEEYTVEYEDLLNNWNDSFLTKKNGDRCFGCKKSEGYFETYSAPTQSLLQKWLREIHNIDISIKPFSGDKIGVKNYVADVIIYNSGTYIRLQREDTYEEALEAGLIRALNLIE